MANPTFQIKRGLSQNLPTSGMLPGEGHLALDRGSLHYATSATTTIPVVPPIEMLADIDAVDLANDYLIIHDASATGVKEKRVLASQFKEDLDILVGKVAVSATSTPVYLWEDGTSGAIRNSTSVVVEVDASGEFVTLNVAAIDCGTF